MNAKLYIPVLLSFAVEQSRGNIQELEKCLEKLPISLEEILNTTPTPEFDRAFKNKQALHAPLVRHKLFANFHPSNDSARGMTATFKHPMITTWVDAFIPLSHIPPQHQSATRAFTALLSCDFALDGSIQSFFILDAPPPESTGSAFLPPAPDFSDTAQVAEHKKQLEHLLGAPVKPDWL